MSILLITSSEGYGNKLFKYITARIYAFNNRLDFVYYKEIDNEIIEFRDPKKYNNKSKEIYKLSYRDFDKNDNLLFYGKKRYILNSYFQNANYINKHRELINTFIKKIKYPIQNISPFPINKYDVLVLIRIGDFVHQGKNSEVLDPNYYINILEKVSFSNIYINIYSKKDSIRNFYLNFFKKFNPIILDQNIEKVDFFTPYQFDNVICSNSTFYWWSLFFSNVKNIYTPKLFGYNGVETSYQEKIIGRLHVKDLWNIKNISKVYDNKFINL